MSLESDPGGSRFERVVLPHLDAAYTLARYLVGDVADAEDAVQEAVLRALRYTHTLRDDGDARAWFLAIVRRECYDLFGRRRARRDAALADAPSMQLVDRAPSPEESTDGVLVAERVRRAIDELSAPMREVLILRELQHCSYEEIATITEVPVGTVMSRLSRARSRLALELRDVLGRAGGAA